MLSDLVPYGVAVASLRGDDLPSDVLSAELRLLGRVSEKRRRDFSAGRTCARRALRALGSGDRPIPIGPRGAPVWPEGYVGSITHCRGYAAAAVAGTSRFSAIGIDAEPDEPLPDGVLELVAGPQERRWLDEFAGVGFDAGRALFTAKEAVYKVWSHMTGRWLDFGEVEVRFDATGRGFGASVVGPSTPDGTPPVLHGGIDADGGFIEAAIVIPSGAVAMSMD